jgi:hypothetical protein
MIRTYIRGIHGPRYLRNLCNTLATHPCDVTSVCVDGWDYEYTNGMGYGAELGAALTNNTSVTELQLHVQGLLGQHQESASEDLRPLLQFIATSQALRTVHLHGGEGLEDLTSRVLQALTQNPSITKFEVDSRLRTSPQAFAHFLMNAPFLRTLDVSVEAFVNFTPDDLATLGAAIGQTETLHELHLYSLDESDYNRIGELILMHLGFHSHQLRTLRLFLGSDATTGHFRALSSALSSAQTLSHIIMENYTFDLDSMALFVAALQSNTTVTTISLGFFCQMEKRPLDVWTQFLKSDKSKIRELRFEPDDGNNTLEGNVIKSNVIGTALFPLLIQSSVRALDLGADIRGEVPSYAMMFDGMTFHESEIRLSKLAIRALDQTVVMALSRFLPHSSSLQELSTSDLFDQTNYRLLLPAIRQNGSLHRVDEENMQVLDRVWQKLVTAYCKRNEMVPKLLAQRQSDTEETDDNESVTLGRIDPCLVPMILFVSQQVPRMAPNNILIGLLQVHCKLGKCRD